MNGSTAGLESADSGSKGDPSERWSRARDIFEQASQAAAALGEWKLQREAEDAAARCEGEIERQRQEALQLGRVDGKDQENARQEAQVSGSAPTTAIRYHVWDY